MRSLSDIDVVVLTYKRDDLLKDCLDSLRRTCGDEPHVIVVRAVRRRVQAARRVSDRELFRIVRRRMPLSYFLRSARS